MRPELALAWLVWVAPLALAGSCFLMVRRMPWQWHPMFICYLLAECYIQVLSSAPWMARHADATRAAAILIMLVLRPGLIQEIGRFARINITRKAQACLAALAIAVCALHAGAHPWSLDYRLSLFRSDVRIAAAVAAVAIAFYRWRVPILECRRHKVYRAGMAAWLSAEAIQGSFVRGGLGTALVPYTPERWLWIGLISYAVLIATDVVVALAMTLSASPRKRAARTGDAWLAAIAQPVETRRNAA